MPLYKVGFYSHEERKIETPGKLFKTSIKGKFEKMYKMTLLKKKENRKTL